MNEEDKRKLKVLMNWLEGYSLGFDKAIELMKINIKLSLERNK